MIFYILFMLFEHLIHHKFSLIFIFASAICRILSGEYVGSYTLALFKRVLVACFGCLMGSSFPLYFDGPLFFFKHHICANVGSSPWFCTLLRCISSWRTMPHMCKCIGNCEFPRCCWHGPKRRQSSTMHAFCAPCRGLPGRNRVEFRKRPASAISPDAAGSAAPSSGQALRRVAPPVSMEPSHTPLMMAHIVAQISAHLQSVAHSLSLVSPNSTRAQFLDQGSWMLALLEDLRTARRVRVCAMLYDSPDLHRALLSRVSRRRLRNNEQALDLQVIVDKQHHERHDSPYQFQRLFELASNDVPVLLGTGVSTIGIMHSKVVLLDDNIAYVGSANCTMASGANREAVVKLIGGPIIQEVQDHVIAAATSAIPMPLPWA